MRIPTDEFRSLFGCQREQVIVVGVGRVNWWRDGRIAGEESGSRQPSHEGVGIRRRDDASRWQGSYFDGACGLYYVNARWYSPSIGTFLSDDPHIADTSDPQERDPDTYTSGDPVSIPRS